MHPEQRRQPHVAVAHAAAARDVDRAHDRERDAGAERGLPDALAVRRRRAPRSRAAIALERRRGVGDLARQPELVRRSIQTSATSAAPRMQNATSTEVGTELQAEQHEERRGGHLDDRAARRRSPCRSVGTCPAAPANSRSGTRSSAVKPMPARAARARRCHHRSATRHAIDHHGQERADQQPHHGAGDQNQCRAPSRQHARPHRPPRKGTLMFDPDPVLVTLLAGHRQLRGLRPPPHRRPPADRSSRRHARQLRERQGARQRRHRAHGDVAARRQAAPGADRSLPGRLLVRHPRSRPVPCQRVPASATRCALALRVVPFRVRSLEELGAPRSVTNLLNRPYGLVLVVGPTGSGKRRRWRR